ncbi:MAG: hypothetical protein NTW95_01370 [Candidatus Aminicenantes bacterium]|nr:hypothetical protein [Candidatus Aminicenantes bacterium]
MKKKLPLVAAGLALFFVVHCGSSNKAINYNDRIVGYQNKIIEKMLALADSFSQANPAAMQVKLLALNGQIDESLAVVSRMQDFKGNTRLRDAAVALFEFYRDIAAAEYAELVDILGKGTGNVTDGDRDRLQEIQSNITAREAEFDKELQEAQKEFALKYNIEVTENKYQKKIDGM